MIPLYSERAFGSKPRTNDEITLPLWKGIIALLERFEQKNYFAEAYPEGCQDNPAEIWATDSNKLSTELELFTGLAWPLKTTKDAQEYWMPSEPYVPPKYEIFDTLEFLFHRTSTPSECSFHPFFNHYHLNFKNDGVAKEEFSSELNRLFTITGMIYEFNPNNGHIEAMVGEETKLLINNALSGKMMDAEYQEMLQVACTNITSFRLEVAYQSLEKLWDAFERLKCYFHPEDKNQKKASVARIISLFADNDVFQAEVEAEMHKVTALGNSLRIRHSEPHQSTLTNHRQINYLFRRCLALVVLIQDQIFTSNM